MRYGIKFGVFRLLERLPEKLGDNIYHKLLEINGINRNIDESITVNLDTIKYFEKNPE